MWVTSFMDDPYCIFFHPKSTFLLFFFVDPEEYAAQNPEPDHGFFEAEEMEIPRQNELAHARNLMLAENGIKLEKI